MKTAAEYLIALFAVVVSAPVRRLGATMLLLALLLPLLLPTAARAARYEDLSVTKLTLDGVVVTNTPARLNAATPAGTAASFPSVTAGSVTIQTSATFSAAANFTHTAQTLTNAAVVSAASPVALITTAVASNNVTLPTATYAGQFLVVRAASTLTNVLVILDTATQGGDITLGANDTITYIASTNLVFTEICRSNN